MNKKEAYFFNVRKVLEYISEKDAVTKKDIENAGYDKYTLDDFARRGWVEATDKFKSTRVCGETQIYLLFRLTDEGKKIRDLQEPRFWQLEVETLYSRIKAILHPRIFGKDSKRWKNLEKKLK